MRSTRIRIETLLVKIAQTRAQEATCDDCAELSAHLAELLEQTKIEDERLIAIMQHLQECIPCAEEFQVLRDCERMEREDAWPSLDELWQRFGSDR